MKAILLLVALYLSNQASAEYNASFSSNGVDSDATKLYITSDFGSTGKYL